MSIPKEPRQQMINLMYLVLTALLALNISKEVLNAFELVKTGMGNSTTAVESKNTSIYDTFQKQLENNEEKTRPYFDQAMKAQEMADEFYTYIGNIKKQLVKTSGGRNEKGELVGKKNLDATTRLMLKKDKGTELKNKIQEYKNKFASLLTDSLEFTESERQQFREKITLSAEWNQEESDKKTWAAHNFRMVPTIAAVTILTKFQNDVRSTESLVIEELIKKISASDYKFDQLEAQVIANSSYVLQGEPYEADIFVSASSSTQNPDVLVGDLKDIAYNEDGGVKSTALSENPLASIRDSLPVDSKGRGKFEQTASGTGSKTYTGAIKVKKPSGSGYDYYPFKQSYQVAQPAITVSPTKLNVLYAGINNPLSISAAGFPNENVSATISGGLNLKKTGEKGVYETNPPGSKINESVKISVSVQMDDGNRQTLGNKEFRIRRVPDPEAAINGTITEGGVKTGTIRASQGIGAVLRDFEFEGVNFDVTSYELLYIPQRQDPRKYENKGWRYSGEVKKAINSAKPGDQLIFRDIKAEGPDGSKRSLNSIPLTVK